MKQSEMQRGFTHERRIISHCGRRTIFRLETYNQWSFLEGPLVFLIYINDLDINVDVFTSKFADDVKIAVVLDC